MSCRKHTKNINVEVIGSGRVDNPGIFKSPFFIKGSDCGRIVSAQCAEIF